MRGAREPAALPVQVLEELVDILASAVLADMTRDAVPAGTREGKTRRVSAEKYDLAVPPCCEARLSRRLVDEGTKVGRWQHA